MIANKVTQLTDISRRYKATGSKVMLNRSTIKIKPHLSQNDSFVISLLFLSIAIKLLHNKQISIIKAHNYILRECNYELLCYLFNVYFI